MGSGEAGGLGIIFAVFLLILCVVVAFAIGRFPDLAARAGAGAPCQLTGTISGVSPTVETVLWQIRGPRIVAAVLCGSALAIAGTAFQGLFRNLLVSPDILGASSGERSAQCSASTFLST